MILTNLPTKITQSRPYKARYPETEAEHKKFPNGQAAEYIPAKFTSLHVEFDILYTEEHRELVSEFMAAAEKLLSAAEPT